jgi:hypothetical protein
LSWALVHVSDKSEILTKQQQNLVHYCSKGDKELEGQWVGFFVDNVPVVENFNTVAVFFQSTLVLFNFQTMNL